MVFDRLLSPRGLRVRPLYAVVAGFVFVVIAFATSLLVFRAEASLVMVAFASLLMLPYVVKIFEFDELDVDIDDTSREELAEWVKKCLRDGFSPQQIKDNLIRNNMDKPHDLIFDLAGVDEEYIKHMRSANVFTRHKQTIAFYVYLFLGGTLAYMLLYGFLTPDLARQAFAKQVGIIHPAPAGMFVGGDLFELIVVNNMTIVLICVFLSLLYGSGAIFILNYNASIVGVLFGSGIRAVVYGAASPYSNLMAYIPHATLEVLAYLIAAISGGVLSKATIGQHPGSIRIWLKDGLILLGVSAMLIFIAGWVEVQVLI